MRAIRIIGIFLIAILSAAADGPERRGTKGVSNGMGFANGVKVNATVSLANVYQHTGQDFRVADLLKEAVMHASTELSTG